MAIDNINLITPLLNFEDKDDFYMLYVFLRKKDQPEEYKNAHQSVRTIKHYLVDSVPYLHSRYEEVKALCEFFKARAYMHVNKQNHKKVTHLMNVRLAERMRDGVVKQHNLFDSIVGAQEATTPGKRFIVDIDTTDLFVREEIKHFINYNCRYEGNKSDRVIAEIPTRNGVHLITKPFSRNDFELKYKHIDIQVENPTVLYIPNSLTNE